jgi:hypothetical protein
MHAEINSRKNPKICRNSRLEIIIIFFFFFDFPASQRKRKSSNPLLTNDANKKKNPK